VFSLCLVWCLTGVQHGFVRHFREPDFCDEQKLNANDEGTRRERQGSKGRLGNRPLL